jgi:hypothetical protein
MNLDCVEESAEMNKNIYGGVLLLVEVACKHGVRHCGHCVNDFNGFLFVGVMQSSLHLVWPCCCVERDRWHCRGEAVVVERRRVGEKVALGQPLVAEVMEGFMVMHGEDGVALLWSDYG